MYKIGIELAEVSGRENFKKRLAQQMGNSKEKTRYCSIQMEKKKMKAEQGTNTKTLARMKGRNTVLKGIQLK